MNEIKFGSVCSGIEAASVAWNPLGWEAAWLSEIEPFPSAVLAHHYPDTPNLGDMTKLVQRISFAEVEAPELFCGGTPCQAFSVAGLRKSLDDARGNLSLVFCEVADVIDSVRYVWGEQPAIIFWENVPGVLNTGDNAFGCFLAGLAGEDAPLQPAGGKWTNAGCVFGPKRTVAWRVLDAQYFGVAQRRKRVFVVASARAGFNPATILFEFNGVRRDIAPSRGEGQRVTPSITSGAPFSRTGNQRVEADAVVTQPYPVANCLTARMHKGINSTLDEGQTPVLTTYAIQGSMIGRINRAGPNGDGVNVEVCFTQNTTDRHAVAHPIVLMDQGGSVMNVLTDGTVGTLRRETHGHEPSVLHPIPLNTMTMQGRPSDNGRMGSGIGEPGDPCPTLTKGHSHAVVQPIAFTETSDCLTAAYGTKWNGNASATNGSLFAFHPTQDPISSTDGTTHGLGCGSSGGQASIAVAYHMAVRRLTPTECERLQGFPDGYTAIPWRNKASTDCPDGPRYKALGNSWAVPVVRWIGERINKEL